MKKRRIIIAVISIIVVAAMVLFDMLYMKKDKKEELPQEEKKVEEIVWITESSIEGVQSEMEEALNALLKKRGCEYKVRFVCFPMETYEEDVAEILLSRERLCDRGKADSGGMCDGAARSSVLRSRLSLCVAEIWLW